MKNIIINGKFMSDRMQGIVRYSRELVSALDIVLDASNIEDRIRDNKASDGFTIGRMTKDIPSITLVIPPNAHDVPEYKNIAVVQTGTYTGIKWEQTSFKKYANNHREAVVFNPCNVVPIGIRPGITTIHDIMYRTKPEDFKSIRNRISRLWHLFQYRYISKHEAVILTDSMWSQKDLEKYYPQSIGKINIVPAAWQHILDYKENPEWNQEFPFLRKGEFYFSLSTLSGHKNGQWIVETARYNPGDTFVIAGKIYEIENYEIPSNVHFLGFVSDENACSLIKNCKAFIHPALYEGFGLPPLEALALGAKVISSDATSLPEVLGRSVHYINPLVPCKDIDQLLSEEVESPEEALERWSWVESARKLLEIAERIL